MTQSGVEVTLPGGLPNDGSLIRRARFQPLTGAIEQAVIELGAADLDRPGYVTAVLGAALERIGELPADAGRVDGLCVADRQYLMLRLGALLDGEQLWLKVQCTHCAGPFDVEVRRCDLPIKEAGPGFPSVTLGLQQHAVGILVPTGEMQQRIVGQSEQAAVRWLLRSCIDSVDGEPPTDAFLDGLTDSDIDAIDEALDEVSPAVCDRLLVTCPECGTEQRALLDHYALTGLNAHFFYDEVHTIASHYHWSEASILGLPQDRRRIYLDKINRSTRQHGRG